jgi:cytochrome c-type biogenesis protein CcsB
MIDVVCILALLCYFLATAGMVTHVIVQKKDIEKISMYFLIAGFSFHTLFLILKWWKWGEPPIVKLSETLCFLSWAISGGFLWAEFKYKIKSLGIFVLPIIFILALTAFLQNNHHSPLSPVLKSFWLPIHASISLMSYAFFFLAFCLSCMFLIQERQIKSHHLGAVFKRLPSLDTTDAMIGRCIKIAFSLLTVAIITGSIWAESAWGNYWSWDPKETWSLILWFSTAAMIHQRLTLGWRGKRFAIMTIIIFFILLFTYLGVMFLMKSLHSYE